MVKTSKRLLLRRALAAFYFAVGVISILQWFEIGPRHVVSPQVAVAVAALLTLAPYPMAMTGRSSPQHACLTVPMFLVAVLAAIAAPFVGAILYDAELSMRSVWPVLPTSLGTILISTQWLHTSSDHLGDRWVVRNEPLGAVLVLGGLVAAMAGFPLQLLVIGASL